MLILGTVEAVEAALAAEGNEVVRVPVNPDGRWIERSGARSSTSSFNLCEGIDGVGALEPAVISVLELFGIPFTGASSYTTAVCLRKHVVNALLEQARPARSRGSPSCAAAARSRRVGFPAIVQAGRRRRVARRRAALGRAQHARSSPSASSAMLERWDEVLVQRYIDGREVNVGILGDTVLPDRRDRLRPDAASGMWRIVTYQSKWDDGSDEDLGAAPRCPARAARRRSPHELRRDRAARVAARRRQRLRPRRHAHRRARPAVDPRGERESRHRARRGARAHGARRRHRVRARSCARSASSGSQRAREAVRRRTSGRSRSGCPASTSRDEPPSSISSPSGSA